MKKIDSFSDKFSFFKSSKKKEKSRVGKTPARFSKQVDALLESRSLLEKFDDSDEAGDLAGRLDEVCATGEKLKEAPTFENIKNYKRAVKNFIAFVAQNMVALEEHVSGVNILKRKRFMIINIVDQKLESLAVEILNNQSQQINILSRIDEINGLLVDLMQ